MIVAYASPPELLLSGVLVAAALAVALRGLWHDDPLPPPRHGAPRSAVTVLPARPFDWRKDDPDLSDHAAAKYDVAAAFDVPPELVGLWPGPPRRS